MITFHQKIPVYYNFQRFTKIANSAGQVSKFSHPFIQTIEFNVREISHFPRKCHLLFSGPQKNYSKEKKYVYKCYKL